MNCLKNILSVVLVCSTFTWATACSSGGSADTAIAQAATPDASGPVPGMSNDAGKTGDAGGSMPTPDKAGMAMHPAAPQVTIVMKMGGALHVTWKLNETELTSVELWRKQDVSAYAKVVGLPGSATAYHDTSATAGASSYCYKVKSSRAGMDSEFSNEACGSP